LFQTLFMTSLATYPKFSSIAFLDFELQQKGVKLNLNFHSKSISQKYVHAFKKLYIYSHWDQKIWVCIFLNFLWISRIFLRCWTKLSPWVHNHALANYIRALAGRGKLAGGEAWSGRSTCGLGMRLGSPGVDWWRWCGWGRLQRAAAARSRRRTCCGSVSGEASDGEDQHAAMGATMGFRDELWRVGRRRELAEVRARGGGGNGRSTGGGAHSRELRRWLFIAEARAGHLTSWVSILGASMRGVRRRHQRACAASGDNAAASAYTPRGARSSGRGGS
jgi:hypothetical protein